MEPIKLFSIGDVAKLFHLSVSSLPHCVDGKQYEDRGLPGYGDLDPQVVQF